MIKILIADDHKVLLDGFLSIFQSYNQIEVVATAANGQQVLDRLKEVEVDIALLDINMPILNGVETCKKIKTKFPKTKVIALSMYRQKSYIKRMIQHGAMGYLLKDDSAEEIIDAITSVHQGKKYFSRQLSSDVFDAQTNRDQKIADITSREQEVLNLIAQGLSNKSIGLKLSISIHTVDSHRKSLLSKFQAKNAAELVRMASEKGLL